MTLAALHELLEPGGTLYFSTRLVVLAGGECPGVEIRPEGRVFIFYTRDELMALFHDVGLAVEDSWDSTTELGTTGVRMEKPWVHFLLRRMLS